MPKLKSATLSAQTAIGPEPTIEFMGQEHQKSVKLYLPDGARFVVLSDAQVPFEDVKLLNSIAKDFIPKFKPIKNEYHLFLAGDILDNYSLSKFPARVTTGASLKDEIDQAKFWLKKFSSGFTHKHYAFGNHEDRYDRFLYENSAQLAPYTKSLAEALELEALDYEHVPYLRHFDVNGFVITHGDTVTVNTAAKMLSTYKSSGASGHVNRPHSYSDADARDGEPVTWHVLGMTCRKDIGDYIKDWRRIQPWQQGFGIGEVSNGKVHFQSVRVHHGEYYAAGRIYKV